MKFVFTMFCHFYCGIDIIFKILCHWFWNKNNRLQKASAEGLTPLQVQVIASIVEEETNKNDEKGNIASVYINRYYKQMPLAADPTIKFALKNFPARGGA